MGIRDVFNRVVDWAADKIQASTGEKERREEVSLLKKLAKDFEIKVSEAISLLNQAIKVFNEFIKKLNTARNTKVKENIENLSEHLGKFGNCKPIGLYTPEEETPPAKFPDREFDVIENYISNIDWSQDEVFFDTFFLSPLGMKIKTRKQNLSMREHIHELQLQTEATLQKLSERRLWTEQETKICAMYVSNVEFIQNIISDKILPELELVEAFLETEKIKNEIVANNMLDKLTFKYDVKCLESTIYHKHYQFIKNAVAFYIISCRIYNTPVLTNLLNNQTTPKDMEQLDKERSLIEYQSKAISNNMVVQRGGL